MAAANNCSIVQNNGDREAMLNQRKKFLALLRAEGVKEAEEDLFECWTDEAVQSCKFQNQVVVCRDLHHDVLVQGKGRNNTELESALLSRTAIFEDTWEDFWHVLCTRPFECPSDVDCRRLMVVLLNEMYVRKVEHYAYVRQLRDERALNDLKFISEIMGQDKEAFKGLVASWAAAATSATGIKLTSESYDEMPPLEDATDDEDEDEDEDEDIE